MPRSVLLVFSFALLVVVMIGVGTAAAQDTTYTVQYGDVLDVVAASVDLSADCIAEQSGLANPNKLRPGDTLVLARNCPPYDGLIPIARESRPESEGAGGGGAARASGGNTYTVERGDVLDLIAAAHDVSVGCLAQANEMANPGKIYVGDVLAIDLDCPPYDGEAFVPNPREGASQVSGGGGGARTYIVKVGDMLDSIGAEFNLSPSCLAESNNLPNPSRIYPGDQIVIDPGCPSYDGLALG